MCPLHHSTDWSPLPAAGAFSLPEQPVGRVAPSPVEGKGKKQATDREKENKGITGQNAENPQRRLLPATSCRVHWLNMFYLFFKLVQTILRYYTMTCLFL